MTTPRNPRHAFTIVELLVVVGIILVLLGLLLPAVSGARRRGHKADEVNRIRQVGIAWNLYSQSNNDAALPGYLASDVQLEWRVAGRYEFPDKRAMPPSESEEWPWRLLPYLDYSQEMLMGHLDLPYGDERAAMGDYEISDFRDVRGDYLLRPKHIAQEPGFGYNAFYIGGWWGDLASGDWYEDPDTGRVYPRPRFHSARSVATDSRVNVIANSPSSIANSSQMVVFCSVAGRDVGLHKEPLPDEPGSHFAIGPFYAETPLWRRAPAGNKGKSETILEVENLVPVPSGGTSLTPTPIGRYTDQAAVLHGDLHTASMAPGALDDQRFWVNGADAPVFQHTEN